MTRTPASIRHNNPGAMWPNAWQQKFGAEGHENLKDGQGNKIATFPGVIEGGAALFYLFTLKGYRGQTLEKAIRKWSGGNHVDSYLRVIKKRAGFAPNTVLSLSFMQDMVTAIPLAEAMSWHEAGQDFGMTDEQWAEAHALFMRHRFPNLAPEPQAPTVAVVESKPEPKPAPTPEAVAAATAPPPKPEVNMRTSRKWRLLDWLKAFFGLGGIGTTAWTFADASTFFKPVDAFVEAYGVGALIFVCFGSYLAFEVIQWWQRQDAEEGRYMPSGAADV